MQMYKDSKWEDYVASLTPIIAAYNVDMEKPDLLADPSARDLHTFWEDAGLSEELGMSASEYFNFYLSQHKSEYIQFDEYDYNKDVAENSVVARNNELIKCIQSRLTDPATFDARYTPGGFTHAKRDANVLKAALYGKSIPKEIIQRVINKDKIETIADAERFADNATKEDLEALDVNRDVTNVLTTCEYNARNRVASKVIGIMANHNTNAVYSKAMNRLALKKSINIFGETLKDLNNSNTGLDYMLTLAELLASSVDAVKTPVLNFLNINSYTANTAALLARLGLSTEEIGLFLNQPIIREICEYAANTGNGSITYAINKIAKKYHLATKSEYKGGLINKTDLFLSLNETNLDKNLQQQNVLLAFKAISAQAQALGDFISKTKYTASNSIDNSIGGLIALIYDNKAANENETLINQHLEMDFGNFDDEGLNKKAKELNSPINSDPKISLEYMQSDEYKTFLDGTPLAFEQMVHDAVCAYIKKICKYFPYTTPQYESVYNVIYNNIVFGTMDKEIIDAINHQLPVYILSTRSDSPFNPDAEVKPEGDTNKKYYTITFPRQLGKFLEDRKALKLTSNPEKMFADLVAKYDFLEHVTMESVIDNELLDNLRIEEYSVPVEDMFGDDGLRYNIGIENNSHFDKDIKTDLTSAWEDLIEDKTRMLIHPEASLGHALFMYNFFIRGYEVGHNAFSNITPIAIKDTLMVTPFLSYNQFYNGLNKGDISSFNIGRFIPLFYSNNAGNNKLVKNLYMTIEQGPIKVDGLPNGEVISELGMPTIIKFDGGSKQDYSQLTVPRSKLNINEGSRAVVNAFKITDRDGKTRLFVLMPMMPEYDGYNFADPNYNVRPKTSPVKYVEIPVKGVKGVIADYSLSEVSFIKSTDPTLDQGDQETGFKEESYIEEESEELGNYRDEVAVHQEAVDLAERAKENKKNNGFC